MMTADVTLFDITLVAVVTIIAGTDVEGFSPAMT